MSQMCVARGRHAREGKGERREGSQLQQPGGQRYTKGVLPKYLDYIGKSLSGKGGPAPGLESQGKVRRWDV